MISGGFIKRSVAGKLTDRPAGSSRSSRRSKGTLQSSAPALTLPYYKALEASGADLSACQHRAWRKSLPACLPVCLPASQPTNSQYLLAMFVLIYMFPKLGLSESHCQCYCSNYKDGWRHSRTTQLANARHHWAQSPWSIFSSSRSLRPYCVGLWLT